MSLYISYHVLSIGKFETVCFYMALRGFLPGRYEEQSSACCRGRRAENQPHRTQ